MKTLLLDIY